jgi:hypothetical protein
MMDLPSSYGLWLTTPPKDDGEAWELYADRYQDAATAIVLDQLSETLPTYLLAQDRAAIVGQLAAVVHALDTETATAWAREIEPDRVPSFEDWARPHRAA